jgi:predicted PurR-regulated permease PerM
MKILFGETTLRILAFAALLLSLALAFITIRILLVPVVAALFVVYLFDPVILLLQRRSVEPGTAFLLVLCVSVIIVAVIVVLLPAGPRLESIVGPRETFEERFTLQLNALERWANAKFPMLASIRIVAEMNTKAAAVAARFFEELPSWITGFLFNLVLVPFIAYFIIRDGKTLKRRLVELIPNRYFEMSLIMFSRIDRQIGGYLRGRLIECILVGLTQALFMSIASIFVPQRYILQVAAVCGITNMIPYLGPILGTIFGVFLYLGSGLPVSSVYTLLAAAAGAHIIDNILIAPTVLSHNVDLHPLTVALVLVIGGELLGALGLLIAIPVASTIKVVVQEFYANYQLQAEKKKALGPSRDSGLNPYYWNPIS